MEDNLRTYRVGMNGEMMPMVNVWMTMEQYSEWLQKKNEKEAEQTDNVLRIPFTGKKNGSPHENHAKPHYPSKYGKQTSRLSEERMQQFIDAYNLHEGDYSKIAKELNVRRSTISSYKGFAVNAGLLSVGDRRKARQVKKGVRTEPFGEERTKLAVGYYNLFDGDVTRLANMLGVKISTARAYISYARQRGWLEEA